MVNLFVLIILEQFEDNYLNPNNPLQNFAETSEVFKKYWVSYTMETEGIRIHEKKLIDFILDLP